MRLLLLLVLVTGMVSASFARNTLWHDDGTIWTDSLTKSGKKVRGLNELGLQLIAVGNYGEAYRILSRSLAVNPYQPAVYINLGISLEHLNRINEARAVYEQAIQYQPDDPVAYYNLGLLYYNALHDRKKALHYLLKAKELDPREPDVHQYLGRIYEDNGDSIRSREEFERYRYLKH